MTLRRLVPHLPKGGPASENCGTSGLMPELGGKRGVRSKAGTMEQK